MKKVISILKKAGIGILPTDTIYGIVGSALSKRAVARIYKLRRRNPKKPFIILIGDLSDLNLFGIHLTEPRKKFLKKIWPGPISVILPCPLPKFRYLHRGAKTLAFRLPKPQGLRRLLAKTGPLVAPSANPEGWPPARTIKEAKKYFGSAADFYVNAGRRDAPPSAILYLKSDTIDIVREGSGIYKCAACGFHYFRKAEAKKCENWCVKNKSCNLDIIKNAAENYQLS